MLLSHLSQMNFVVLFFVLFFFLFKTKFIVKKSILLAKKSQFDFLHCYPFLILSDLITNFSHICVHVYIYIYTYRFLSKCRQHHCVANKAIKQKIYSSNWGVNFDNFFFLSRNKCDRFSNCYEVYRYFYRMNFDIFFHLLILATSILHHTRMIISPLKIVMIRSNNNG